MVILFAVIGMICWGIAPVFGKLGLNGVSPITAISLRTLMASFMVVGWVVAAKTYTDFMNVPPLFWLFIAIEAILATLVGDLAYFVALKYGNVNTVSLIMSCAPVVTLLANFLILGEIITLRLLLGALFICIGLGLVCFR
jgi:bacterial/archaeal transporter family protein